MDKENIINENNTELTGNIVNSINLLVEVANKTPRNEEINRLEQEIQELETAKNDYTEELKEEFELDKKNLNDKVRIVKKLVNQKIDIHRKEIETTSKKIEEYEQDIEEQKVKMEEEKRQLEEIAKLPKTRENMLKKAELEWGIVAYEEYLDFMYNEVDELKLSILETREKIRTIKEEAHEELDRDVHKFNTKYNLEYGDKNPTYENNELLMKMNETLKEKQEELNYYKQDPKALANEIIEDMQNGVEVEQVRVKLENLTSLIGGKVTGVIDLEEEKRLQKQYERLEQEQSKVEERITQDDYIDKEQKAYDQELMERYRSDINTYQQEVRKLEEQLDNHEKQRELPKMKRELKNIDKFIKKSQPQQEMIRKYNKEKAVSFARIVDDFSREKESLENEIKELESKPRVLFIAEIKHEINNYKTRIKTKEKNLEELSKKTDTDYINEERKNDDLYLLGAIKHDINVLVEKTNALNEHDPYELTENILDEYQNQLDQQPEEVVTFTSAKDALIEKIKSSQFAVKASSAISNIATLFKKKSSNKDAIYNELIDNVTENFEENIDYSNMKIEPTIEEEQTETVRRR